MRFLATLLVVLLAAPTAVAQDVIEPPTRKVASGSAKLDDFGIYGGWFTDVSLGALSDLQAPVNLPASTSYFYVSPDATGYLQGSDANPGTAAQPWLTLLNCASLGVRQWCLIDTADTVDGADWGGLTQLVFDEDCSGVVDPLRTCEGLGAWYHPVGGTQATIDCTGINNSTEGVGGSSDGYMQVENGNSVAGFFGLYMENCPGPQDFGGVNDSSDVFRSQEGNYWAVNITCPFIAGQSNQCYTTHGGAVEFENNATLVINTDITVGTHSTVTDSSECSQPVWGSFTGIDETCHNDNTTLAEQWNGIAAFSTVSQQDRIPWIHTYWGARVTATPTGTRTGEMNGFAMNGGENQLIDMWVADSRVDNMEDATIVGVDTTGVYVNFGQVGEAGELRILRSAFDGHERPIEVNNLLGGDGSFYFYMRCATITDASVREIYIDEPVAAFADWDTRYTGMVVQGNTWRVDGVNYTSVAGLQAGLAGNGFTSIEEDLIDYNLEPGAPTAYACVMSEYREFPVRVPTMLLDIVGTSVRGIHLTDGFMGVPQ